MTGALGLAALALLASASPLAAQQPPPQPQAQTQASQDKPWWERFTVFGDVRLRYEGFYQDGTPTRNRERIRLRFGVRARASDEFEGGMRIASGDPRDPTTTNQTLEDAFGRKAFYIDQAYITYQPKYARALTFSAGKFAHPMLRTQLVWDDDLSLDGVYEQVATAGDVSFRLVGIQSPIDEVAAGPDAALFGEQAMLLFKAGRHQFQIGASSYGYRQVDRIAGLWASGELRSHNTNQLTFDANGKVIGFASAFTMVEVIGQAAFVTPRPEYPLSIVGDWVVNTGAAGDQDTGWWIETRYGRAASPGTWQVNYTAARIERDAVLSLFMFSDIPGTNLTMNSVGFSYMPARRVNLDVLGIFTKSIDWPAALPNPVLTRLQIDARVSF